MKMFMMSSAAALLIAGTALAQSDWDTNADGMVDSEEFAAGMGDNAFGEWDADGDGMLSRAEYEAGVEASEDAESMGTWDDRYSEWDADEDEMLSGEEYSTGLFGAFDSDADEMWSEEERAAWDEDKDGTDAFRSGREVSR
jgi:EF hand